MSEEGFWKLINDVLVALGPSHSIEKHLSLYREALDKLATDELFDFIGIQQFYLAKADTHNLSQAAFIVSNGCGDDDYEHFTAGLIVQGKEIYFSALANPEATLLELQVANRLKDYFPLTYAANMIHSERTGDENVDFVTEGFEITPNPTETDKYSEDPKVLKHKFPKLFEKYWLGDRE